MLGLRLECLSVHGSRGVFRAVFATLFGRGDLVDLLCGTCGAEVRIHTMYLLVTPAMRIRA
jgi:hypothetical protein